MPLLGVLVGGSDWVMPLSESLRFAELFDAAFALMKK